MLQKIKYTSDFITRIIQDKPEIGIILGTGLGNLGESIEQPVYIPYSDIPNFPVSTVKGHQGRLIFGSLSGKKVIAMQGRFHYYEGYTMQEVTFPVRIFKELGIKYLLISNAAGGMNPDFVVGDIMLISDHINLMPSNPLIGTNYDELGPRFPDMSEPYNKTLISKLKEIARKNNIKVQQGVYASVSGPCFETPSEYRYMRTVGADAVGMSTVPEVIVARHSGLDCIAISIITDLGGGEIAEKVSHEDVLKAAAASEPKLTLLVRELLSEI